METNLHPKAGKHSSFLSDDVPEKSVEAGICDRMRASMNNTLGINASLIECSHSGEVAQSKTAGDDELLNAFAKRNSLHLPGKKNSTEKEE